MRFSGGSPFSNPFSSKQEPNYTGSVAAAPSSSVSTAPLGPVSSSPYGQGGYQQGGYQQPASQPNYQQPSYSQSSYQQPNSGATRMGADRDWSLQGGTPITVGPNDSLQTISSRYGVPASAIVATNGLSPTQALAPGQRITIPVFRRAGGAATASVASSAPAPTVTASTAPAASRRAGGSHTVGSGETLFSLSRTYGVSHRDIAAANGIAPDAQLRIGQTITIPGMNGSASQAVAAAPKPVQQQPAQQPGTQVASAYAPTASATPSVVASQAVQQQTPRMQAATPKPQETVATVQPVVARPDDTATTTAAASNGGKPDFRWPVRGRVISGYGSKPNGKQNDGINLAVPEGTPIRAAESGTVAYSGNELAGYGNLVLIRHDGGWVTAYAHASELLVKKGDVVRRGQVVARAGRSGDVSAPQLHFEVRRGSNPVDPLEQLPRS
ncbi:lipoprotein [Agaricicola taiwanensis]|uniref:Lipoprotein n=2 Tax=Agaricicola taiwanensis TaxID=591372 RepID=A0A8J2YIJ8_9RHOB|nr:lipoprotein [Agaricicola taiwanensis]